MNSPKRYHIVKRNPSITGPINSRTGGGRRCFVQTRLNGKKPLGWKAEEGDEIYEYETGYKIWSKGVITLRKEPEIIDKLDGLLAYISDQSGLKSGKYWGEIILNKVWPAMRKKKFKYISIFECFADMEILTEKFVPEEGRDARLSWVSLNHPPNPDIKSPDLSTRIPRTMYLEIFEKYNIEGDTAYYDIDHFVPASVGGPGNIEENLYPIGSRINRIKSDRIHVGLFKEAKRLGIVPVETKYLKSKPRFHKSADAKKLAEKICSKVNEDFDRDEKYVRDFYFRVRQHFFRNLSR